MTSQEVTTTTPDTATRGNFTPNNNEPILVGVTTCRDLVFPDEQTRPGIRTFLEWKARRYFPTVKIGKRVFCDPVKVRAALERRFEIQAIDAQ